MATQVQIKNYQAQTVIKQEFSKNKSSRLTWHAIEKNKNYRQFFLKFGLIHDNDVHKEKIRKSFKKAVNEIRLKVKDPITGAQVPQYYYDEGRNQFVRRSQFQSISNYDTLIQYVQRHPKGVLVNEELLCFTYRDIQKDIDKATNQRKQLRKIMSSDKKQYYIFSNKLEKNYGLKSDRYDFYGQRYFIDLCKENYKYYTQINEEETTNNSNVVSLTSHRKFNEWVPGYAELKKEWLLKNYEKEKQIKKK